MWTVKNDRALLTAKAILFGVLFLDILACYRPLLYPKLYHYHRLVVTMLGIILCAMHILCKTQHFIVQTKFKLASNYFRIYIYIYIHDIYLVLGFEWL